MTIVEPVAGRLQAIMATTPVVDRAKLGADLATTLIRDLRRLCADAATRLCADEYPDRNTLKETADPMLLSAITVAEGMAAQVALLQQELWARAAAAGITDTAVAKARGVTQQAHSKVKKAQPK